MEEIIAQKKQLSKVQRKNNNETLKGIFFLYGKHDSGKSSALAWLAFSLVYGRQGINMVQQNYNCWRNALRAKGHKIKNTLAFPDIRVIVPYKNTYIFISLYGDDLKSINATISFFEGKLDFRKIYYLDVMGLRLLNQTEQDFYNKYYPSVFVSACFYSQYVEAPLRVFEINNHRSTQMTSWIQMPHTKIINNNSFDCKIRKYGDLLKKLIDESLKLP